MSNIEIEKAAISDAEQVITLIILADKEAIKTITGHSNIAAAKASYIDFFQTQIFILISKMFL